MDTIIVKVSDLLTKLQEVGNDKMDYCQLSLYEAETDSPAWMLVQAWKKNGVTAVDYEEIDAVDSHAPNITTNIR
ncbi:MAG: hypothetical protein LBS91_03420 [Clostridiales Family XIII bacterium]|jgi:hypothetical protein|nr:hypothetical protein [Clostridiales Family XIII bacterium]